MALIILWNPNLILILILPRWLVAVLNYAWIVVNCARLGSWFFKLLLSYCIFFRSLSMLLISLNKLKFFLTCLIWFLRVLVLKWNLIFYKAVGVRGCYILLLIKFHKIILRTVHLVGVFGWIIIINLRRSYTTAYL
jgi:hypothetical protein